MAVSLTRIALRSRWSRRAMAGLHVVAVLIVAYWAAVAWLWPYRAAIPATVIRAEAGQAAAVDLKRLDRLPPFAELRADTLSKPRASRLALYEDGRRLGPAHTLHQAIRDRGGGAYSHWGGEIVFSSSDGTDPRSNGRRYAVAARMRPTRALDLMAALSVALLAWPMAFRLAPIIGLAVQRSWLGVRSAPPASRLRARRRALRAAQIAAALMLAYWATAEFHPWASRVALRPEQIAAGGAAAFTAPIPQPAAPLVTFRGDTPDTPESSPLSLSEDGRPLGPPHVIHDDIRKLGGGRYSHWGRTLVFSSSDGSDPRSNGRTYAATVPVTPTRTLQLLGFVSLVFLLPLLTAAAHASVSAIRRALPRATGLRGLEAGLASLTIRDAGYMRACAIIIPRAAGLLSRPLSLAGERWLTAWMALGAGGAALAVILGNWLGARSPQFALAGLLPLSDAIGYFACANSLIDLGHFQSDIAQWCSRRPIYPSMLGTLFTLGGRNLQTGLLIQGAMIALAIAALGREISRLAGVAGATLSVTLLCAFAASTAFSTTMTENAGLAIGAVGLALLLRGAETGKRGATYAGIAFLSLALNARAGSLFVLPLLVLWTGLDARLRRRGIVTAMALACGAVGLGFAMDFALMALNGASLAQAHSAFAYTLYGLAVGGKGWSQVYADHPEITSLPPESVANMVVYRLAIAAIKQHPALIVHALAENLVLAWNNGIGLRGGYLGIEDGALWWLWAAGFLAIAVRWRDPRCVLLGTLAAGGFLSAPFIIQDGGTRVFAATIGADAAQASLGLGFICQIVARLGPSTTAPVAPSPARLPRLSIALGASLVIATLACYTPPWRLAALPTREGPACPEGDFNVVTQIGRGSPILAITQDGPASIDPPRVPLPELVRSAYGLIQDDLVKPVPYSLLLAYQRRAGADDRGQVYPVRLPGDMAGDYGAWVHLCLVADDPNHDNMWGARYVAEPVPTLDDPARH